MKKYLLLLFTFIFIIFSYSDAGIVILRTREVPIMCSSCPDGAAGGDLLCEDAEGTGAVCDSSPTWTDGVGSGSVDWDNTPTGSWTCSETNAQNLEIAFVSADHTKTSVLHSSSPTYGVFYFKILSESINDSEDAFIFLVMDDGLSYYIVRFQLMQTSGNLWFRISQRNDSNGWTDKTDMSSDYYTVGTEVRVRFNHDATSGTGTATWYVKIGSGSEHTISFSEDDTDDGEHFGQLILGYTGADSDWTGEFDFIRFDDDTMPAACSGDSY